MKTSHLFKNYSLKELGLIDVTPILKEFKSLKEEDWEKYTDRQNNKVTAQKQTRYIPIIYDGKTEFYYEFPDTLNIAKDTISKVVGNISINRAIFTELPPGAVITPHMDSGIFLETNTRIHIPLVSNNMVEFKVHDGSKWNSYYLEPGRFYALNNCKNSHAVSNKSELSRYHLIVDIKLSENSSVI